jgi:hypothetical protein
MHQRRQLGQDHSAKVRKEVLSRSGTGWPLEAAPGVLAPDEPDLVDDHRAESDHPLGAGRTVLAVGVRRDFGLDRHLIVARN